MKNACPHCLSSIGSFSPIFSSYSPLPPFFVFLSFVCLSLLLLCVCCVLFSCGLPVFLSVPAPRALSLYLPLSAGAHAFSLSAPPRAASSFFLAGGGIPNQPEAPTSTAAALSLPRARTSTRKTSTLSASPCPPLLFPGADRRLLGEKRNVGSGISKFGSSPKGRFISSLSSTGGGGGGRDDGNSPRGRRGLLRRVVQRVVKTGKTVGQQVRF